MCQANGFPKQVGVTIYILHKVDLKSISVKWDKEGHFILIKGIIHQKEITVINLYASNLSASVSSNIY
jgi:hypothetical protein